MTGANLTSLQQSNQGSIVYTTYEVAKILKLNYVKVRQLIRTGRLKGTNISSPKRPIYRFTQKQLDNFLGGSNE